jgi:uncharacterized RDD family membrane protein YckC
MSSAAQREEAPNSYQKTGTDGPSALKELAAERLAAHRNRRAVVEGREAQVRREQAAAQVEARLQARRDAVRGHGHPDMSRVREAVAERYQKSLSYRDFLAAEAERAIAQARAEAEVAARNAVAVEAAQRQLLEEIEQWKQDEVPDAGADSHAETLFGGAQGLTIVEVREEFAAREEFAEPEEVEAEPAAIPRAKRQVREDPSFDFETGPESAAAVFKPAQLQVRLPEEVEWTQRGASYRAASSRTHGGAEELAELDDEIEFRLAPEFPDLVLETQTIPGNIIEFPRELVASRKARPRLAEGPLLSEQAPEPQLRIFEVAPDEISVAPESAVLAGAPEWQGMLLGGGHAAEGHANFSRQLEAQLQLDQLTYAAPVTRRALAVTVDGLCVAAGLAGFAAMVIKIAGPALYGMPRPLLGGAVAGIFLFFALAYQLLFFTLNDATPGMRMARVAFCTFRENNPSRKAIRRRMISTALAACPLGLGLVWMVLDGDGLGWHDRMSRMYPRAY